MYFILFLVGICAGMIVVAIMFIFSVPTIIKEKENFYRQELQQLTHKHNLEIRKLTHKHSLEIESYQQEFEQHPSFKQLKESHRLEIAQKIAQIKAAHQRKLQQTEDNHYQQTAQIKAAHQREIAQLNAKFKQDLKRHQRDELAQAYEILNDLKTQAAKYIGGIERGMMRHCEAWLNVVSRGLDNAHRTKLRERCARVIDRASGVAQQRADTHISLADMPLKIILDIEDNNEKMRKMAEFATEIIARTFGEIRGEVLSDLRTCVQDIATLYRQEAALQQKYAQAQESAQITKNLAAFEAQSKDATAKLGEQISNLINKIRA